MLWLWVAQAVAAPVFVDASDRLGGVRLQSVNNSGSGYSGVAILDFDGDGHLDLYFGNGPGRANALFHNQGDGTFVNVAEAAGAAVGTGTGGVLAADLDNDGFPDLVLPGDRSDLRTLRNRGDGTFVDATAFSGLTGARRNVSAHAGDIDGDGDLDVFVTGSIVPERQYINTLWRNEGGGQFTEIGVAAGVRSNTGACAATFTHLDHDAAIDLVVANCNDIDFQRTPFEVYRNLGDGTFEDYAAPSGILASDHFMALAFLDLDRDGHLDFFSTNVGTVGAGRTGPHVLYRATGDGSFEDVAHVAGVAERTFGWGAVAADFDKRRLGRPVLRGMVARARRGREPRTPVREPAGRHVRGAPRAAGPLRALDERGRGRRRGRRRAGRPGRGRHRRARRGSGRRPRVAAQPHGSGAPTGSPCGRWAPEGTPARSGRACS